MVGGASEMSVDVLERDALRQHEHLQVVQQLRDLHRGVLDGLVLRGHPDLGGLLDDLLADRVHAGVDGRDGAGALTALGEGSGTVAAVDAGVHEIGKKIVEEAAEVWMAAEHEGEDRTAEEISQQLYHLQVLMLARGLTLADVYRHL